MNNTDEFKHFKLHNDSTLKLLKKEELIDYIHMLYHNWSVTDEAYLNVMELAKKMSDKATPKKPLGLSLTHDGRVGNCPFCKKLVRERSKNICECGQKLDWSDERC